MPHIGDEKKIIKLCQKNGHDSKIPIHSNSSIINFSVFSGKLRKQYMLFNSYVSCCL